MSVPLGCPPFDADGLDGLPAVATQAQVAAFFNVKPARVREWMRGVMSRTRRVPPLPFVRIARDPYFNRGQVAWWMRQLQEAPDPAMIDVQRALREETPAR